MLKLGPLELESRLVMGTGRYPDFATMRACHEASGTGLVTVALRRIDPDPGRTFVHARVTPDAMEEITGLGLLGRHQADHDRLLIVSQVSGVS